MKKILLRKISWAEERIRTKSADKDDSDDLKRWIEFFRHERLIHLIVTVFVGLCDMISIVIIVLGANYSSFILTALLTLLFILYILHYYALENGTQKLYLLFDEMSKTIRAKTPK
ncbi:MAG: hypothetical protein LBB59_08980 [Campylobacteraceae bacterium]|jgi:hypothetical protein|nr:hypothetical protein [Campylobacteraceae bacterium]